MLQSRYRYDILYKINSPLRFKYKLSKFRKIRLLYLNSIAGNI